MNRQNVKIGLFGYGVVGQGLHDVLNESKGFHADITRICVKDKTKKRRIPMYHFTFDKRDILDDPGINLVVELINDAEEAYNIVTTALNHGKNVVTANKKMIAEHMEDLIRLQEKNKASLLYEGAVCGAIPIIRNLEEYYDNELLVSLRGVFNGSTNYILSKMHSESMSYSKALSEAQRQGFVESDPELDVSGTDANYKLSIIIEHAYGMYIPPWDIFYLGIKNINAEDIRFAKEKGYRIKLVPYAGRIGGNELTAFVLPRFISEDKKLFMVENEYNGVVVEAAFAEKQFFYGKGAGGHPTGSAVLSDISANSYFYTYEYKKRKQKLKLSYTTDVTLEVYFRYHDRKDSTLLEFEKIIESYSGPVYSFITGKIKLQELIYKKQQILEHDVCVINIGAKPEKQET